ncbi:MAG: hypothetical protein HY060_24465, partial [Proteobacteria bacterium]|nr:hypothetical protein [Pseudomonadota bacterium]
DESIELFAEVAAVNPAGMKSDEFYFALLEYPDPAKALAVVDRLLSSFLFVTKMIELRGRLLRKQAAAAGQPGPDIEGIGDSHAVTNFSSIARCRVHWIGPRTMHHVARQSIDLAALGIGAGARLVVVLGEVDCRCHMVEMMVQTGMPAAALCRRVASGFVASLERTMARGGAVKAAICSILPPPQVVDRDHPDHVANAENLEFPVVGSAEERRQMAVALNQALAEAADRRGIGYLDIVEPFVDYAGFLDPAKSGGGFHVDFRLTDPIAARLAALFGPPPAA